VKKIIPWLLCVVFVILAGCGMFGDTRLYTGILGLCAKCHADGAAPSKATLLETAPPGPRGPASSLICPTRCTFSMGHGPEEKTRE